MRSIIMAIDSGGIIFSFPFICFDFKEFFIIIVIHFALHLFLHVM